MDRLNPKYIDAIRYLYDRINYEKNTDRPYDARSYRLARMEYLLGLMGNPQLAAPVIHIAGTKGKGSVSWLIAETLRRSGKTVGLYTSPHLMHLEERFVVNGSPCSLEEIVEHVDRLKHASDSMANHPLGTPTFFEMTTALAWLIFQSRKTDVNVIEVGLGGRLDSTNVCRSNLAIITSISFDHQQQLGNTIPLITREKAGIIKPHEPVISGARHPEARKVIRKQCQATGNSLWELGVDFEVSTTLSPPSSHHIDFIPSANNNELVELKHLPLGMLGKHQSDNAAIAIAAWQRLNLDGWNLSRDALQDAIEKTQLCCRIELVRKHPTTIIDTSHNVASIGAMIETLSSHFSPKKRTIIFACSKDKEFEKMLEQVLEYADRLVVTQFQNNPRCVQVERLEELVQSMLHRFPQVELLSAPAVQMAIQYASDSAMDGELICITGSFFLAAEARPLFDDIPVPPK